MDDGEAEGEAGLASSKIEHELVMNLSFAQLFRISLMSSFIEETVVRGQIIVYEKSHKETKDNLVLAFTSAKTHTLSGNVSTEAELFEPTAFPAADRSTGISTGIS